MNNMLYKNLLWFSTKQMKFKLIIHLVFHQQITSCIYIFYHIVLHKCFPGGTIISFPFHQRSSWPMKGNQCKRSLFILPFPWWIKNNNFTCFLHGHQYISKQMKSVVVFLYIALRQAWVYFASMERSLLPLKWFIILLILSR